MYNSPTTCRNAPLVPKEGLQTNAISDVRASPHSAANLKGGGRQIYAIERPISLPKTARFVELLIWAEDLNNLTALPPGYMALMPTSPSCFNITFTYPPLILIKKFAILESLQGEIPNAIPSATTISIFVVRISFSPL